MRLNWQQIAVDVVHICFFDEEDKRKKREFNVNV